jgi:methanogenesis imperfect marker protein 11
VRNDRIIYLVADYFVNDIFGNENRGVQCWLSRERFFPMAERKTRNDGHPGVRVQGDAWVSPPGRGAEEIPGYPYVIRYPGIVAIAHENGTEVELIEFFDCIGGAMWSQHHYAQSPLVRSARNVGSSMRYLIRPGKADLDLQGSSFPAGICGAEISDAEIAISYVGIGGGGVGASDCRSYAGGVLRRLADPSGGGKRAGSTVWLPRMQRVLIGVDDTDTPEKGASWTLAHNIARAAEDEMSRYLSHTIVQLFPVPYRTKNCVSIVCEFASSKPSQLIGRFHTLLEKYTLSDETGMAVFTGFDPSPLFPFAWMVKKGEVQRDLLPAIGEGHLEFVMKGRGIIGAVAAIPFYTRFDEALSLWTGSD